jgi:hypothetical protein
VLETEAVTEQRELSINPANEFEPLLIRIESGITDWTKVARVDVKLLYDDRENQFQANQLFTFKQGQEEPRDWVVYPLNKAYRTYTVTYGYTLIDEQGNTSAFDLDPEERSDEGIIVPPPFKGSRTVRVIPAVDKEDVQEITAEILFEQKGYRFHRQLVFEANNLAVQPVTIPVPDPNPDTDVYKARWSILYRDFDTHEVDWQEMHGDRVMLGDGVHVAEVVKLELVNPPAQLGLAGILFQFESLNPGGQVVDLDRHLLKGDETTRDLVLLLERDTPLHYRYSFTKIFPDGRQEPSATFEGEDVFLLPMV